MFRYLTLALLLLLLAPPPPAEAGILRRGGPSCGPCRPGLLTHARRVNLRRQHGHFVHPAAAVRACGFAGCGAGACPCGPGRPCPATPTRGVRIAAPGGSCAGGVCLPAR